MRGAFTKKVSTKKLICEMPRPKKRGKIMRATLRIPGWLNEKPKSKRIPRRTNCGTRIKNCSAPPTKTPTASETAGLLKWCQTAAVEKMMIDRLRNTVVAAGRAKLWKEFK